MKLTAADERLAAALPAGTLYAVGGRVRDEIRAAIGQTDDVTADSDYVATGLPMEALAERFQSLGRVDRVGVSFSVLKVSIDGDVVDVSVPRREHSTGSGHRDFAVQSDPDISIEEDLARRDFRMNMMARAIPSGRIIDPYGGEADIRARRIDILSPRTFQEDPLRMLRAAQFAARFAYVLTDAATSAMCQSAALIESVSADRVHDELVKLLTKAEKPSLGFELLRSTGVLSYLWPELLEGIGIEQNEWHAFDVWTHAMATLDAAPAGGLVGRLAALLHDVGKPRTKQGPHFYRHELVGAEMAAEMLERFRFPAEVVRNTSHLVRHHMYSADPQLSDAGVRRFIRRIEPQNIEHMFALRIADIAGSGLPKRDDSDEIFQRRVREELARRPAFSVRDLAIGGDDVVAALVRRGAASKGFRGDERVGAALQWLFEQVTDEPQRNERTLLLQLLEQYLTHDAATA